MGIVHEWTVQSMPILDVENRVCKALYVYLLHGCKRKMPSIADEV